MKIYSNKIKCKHCGDVIESKHVHDFKYCSCKKCAVDGGLEYLRRVYTGFAPEDDYIELSKYRDDSGEGRGLDYISRDDAISALLDASEYSPEGLRDEWSGEIGVTCKGIVDALNELPAVQVFEGEWVEDEEQNHVELMYRCSECGFIAWGKGETTNYCPNCGSYNGGGKNEA